MVEHLGIFFTFFGAGLQCSLAIRHLREQEYGRMALWATTMAINLALGAWLLTQH